ncbi:hypothetical protein BC351_25185 [Paenibacillus ferrarius]|uniref:Uncharacterized protein n=1 Tax=Paenibacillus ferrarius TaxID=1469647 RepID=A0A1V4HK28_9BACL|nr:hypothetical protein [Paenibacillus ferrarius]OPH57167.1 hypothetical protein BC351_25185 [Paenibacillus ferrarius]
MESDSDKKKEHREITYQVGWKKGKIAWNEGAADALSVKDNHAAVSSHNAEDKHLQLIWKPALSLPEWLLFPILFVLPILCFSFTLILMYGLRNG